MPKGKRGPRPEMTVTAETGVTVIEESFLDDSGPTAEEIVGKENVVDVGSGDPSDNPPMMQQHFMCANCTFRTDYMSEMEEHASATGHGRAPVSETPVQPELFSGPKTIRRPIEIPLPQDQVVAKHANLAELYQMALDVREEKKTADEGFNSRLKDIDSQMQAIARVLRNPTAHELVECEWRRIDEENARGLYRLDTGEIIEKEPLTAEDMADDAAKAQEDNAATDGKPKTEEAQHSEQPAETVEA
jgi:hypothetical protein